MSGHPPSVDPDGPTVWEAFADEVQDVDWSEQPSSLETILGIHRCHYYEDHRGKYVIITCETPPGMSWNLGDFSAAKGGTFLGTGGFRYYYEPKD